MNIARPLFGVNKVFPILLVACVTRLSWMNYVAGRRPRKKGRP